MRVAIFVVGLSVFPSIAFAQVVINEVAWMGIPVEGVDSRQEWRYEWLELFNEGGDNVPLEDWSVELYRGAELYFAIPLSGSIAPGGYLVAGTSDKIPEVDVSYDNLGGKFLNEGMKLVLRDAFGNVAHELAMQDGWKAGDNDSKRTMEKTEQGWHTSKEPGGSPGTENSEGFKEQNPAQFSELYGASKKDLGGSSLSFWLNPAILVALPVALLSALLAVALRRWLSRGEETFGAPQD